jgi:hypothetical protein
MTTTTTILFPLCAALAVLCASCAESEEVIRGKLDVILADDMAAIVDSVAAPALMENPRFEVVSYKEYDEGAYSRMAVVDFFFLKPLAGAGKKIMRKYRYHRRLGLWDRYHNKYYTYMPDSAGVGGGGE